MTILKLPNIVYPLQHLDKTNEIIDVVNAQLNTSYSEQNPALTPVEGVATWTVTHNLGTEDVSCTVYQGDSEVLADITVTSANVVTIKMNSSSNIVAETYSVLVLAKGGLTGSGSSITVDSSLSTTSENPVQNKVITTVLNGKLDSNNFLPAGTTINVKLDGTGDFNNLPDAISYLTGKYSNGMVTVQLGDGVFEVSDTVSILGDRFNIPTLRIRGNGVDKTTVKQTGDKTCFNLEWGQHDVYFQNLKIQNVNKNSTGVQVGSTLFVLFDGIIIDNFVVGISNIGGISRVASNVTIQNCTYGVSSDRLGCAQTNGGSQNILFSNVGTAWRVTSGGMVACVHNVAQATYTNVTNICSQAINTWTANGYICGNFPS